MTCPHPTCGYEWTPRKENPKKCPQCQNPIWKSARPKRHSIAEVTTASQGGGQRQDAPRDKLFEDGEAIFMLSKDHVYVPMKEDDPLAAVRKKVDALLRQMA